MGETLNEGGAVRRLEPANMTPAERGLWLVRTDAEFRDRIARNIYEARMGGWRHDGMWEALTEEGRERLRQDAIHESEESVRRERMAQTPQLFRRVSMCLTCTNDAPIHLYCDDCMDAIAAHRAALNAETITPEPRSSHD